MENDIVGATNLSIFLYTKVCLSRSNKILDYLPHSKTLGLHHPCSTWVRGKRYIEWGTDSIGSCIGRSIEFPTRGDAILRPCCWRVYSRTTWVRAPRHVVSCDTLIVTQVTEQLSR